MSKNGFRKILSLNLALILAVSFVLSCFLCSSIWAADEVVDIEINAVNFPDENFRNYVKSSAVDKSQNGRLSSFEITDVTSLDVSKMGIADLKGIEYFTEITYLNCSGNELTSLDLSNNTKLASFDIYSKSLEGKYVTVPRSYLNWVDMDSFVEYQPGSSIAIVSTQEFHLFNNDIARITLNSNTTYAQTAVLYAYAGIPFELPYVSAIFEGISLTQDNTSYRWGNAASSRNLTELWTPGKYYIFNTNTELYVQWNSTFSIEGEPIPFNETYFPDANFRKYLQGKNSSTGKPFDENNDGYFSKEEAAAISVIRVAECGIESLEGIQYFENLHTLICDSNNLEELHLNNKNLRVLSCSDNSIASLDISNCTKLVNLGASGNRISELDLGFASELETLHFEGNPICLFDLGTNKKLQTLSLSYCIPQDCSAALECTYEGEKLLSVCDINRDENSAASVSMPLYFEFDDQAEEYMTRTYFIDQYGNPCCDCFELRLGGAIRTLSFDE